MQQEIEPLFIPTPTIWTKVRRYFPLASLLFFCFVCVAEPPVSASEGDSLPFVTPLDKLKQALTGKVATAIATIGVCVAGGMLIFGGQLDAFFRTMCLVVAASSVMVLANKVIEFLNPQSPGAEFFIN